MHHDNKAVKHPPPPPQSPPIPQRGGVCGGGHFGEGCLKELALFGLPHGARICSSSPCAFLPWAVASSRSLRSFSLRPAPPCLFPPTRLPHPLLCPLNVAAANEGEGAEAEEGEPPPPPVALAAAALGAAVAAVQVQYYLHLCTKKSKEAVQARFNPLGVAWQTKAGVTSRRTLGRVENFGVLPLAFPMALLQLVVRENGVRVCSFLG